MLAAQGFVSRTGRASNALQGFGDTHAGECRDVDASLADLGTRFWFEAVQHKFHACCHGTHAALDALRHWRGARRRAGAHRAGRPQRSIRAGSGSATFRATHRPRAKFSYRLTSAMALAGRDTGALDAFTDEACAEPALMALRDRVRVEADAPSATRRRMWRSR